MKKVIDKIILFFILMLILFYTKSYATGNFSISASKTTINKDESVTLNIKANNAYGKVNIEVTNATVSPSSVFLQNDTKTVTIKPTSNEDIEVTVSPDSSGLGDIDENPITTSQSMTIKVSKPETNTNTGSTTQTPSSPTTNTTTAQTKSSVATLSNLGITPNDFTGFSPSKTAYSVTVPNEVESVEVYAKKGQIGQTITGTGKKALQEGENLVTVTVTAEDGKTKKTYTINIIRQTSTEQQENETTEENTEENTEIDKTFGLKELRIEGIDVKPKFETNTYEYTVELKEDVEKLNLTALATDENASIEVVGNENFKDGENLITIVVKDKENTKTATYQITVNKNIQKEEIVEENNNNIFKNKKIILACIAGLVVIMIIVVIIAVKSRKKDEYYNFEDGIPYSNLDNDTNKETIDDVEEDEEQPKKKKRSKGKRFK